MKGKRRKGESYEKITLVPLSIRSDTADDQPELDKLPSTVRVGMKPNEPSRVPPVPLRVSVQSEPNEMYLLPTKYLLQSLDL